MDRSHCVSFVRALLVILFVGVTMDVVAPAVAEARVGGGRSVGRSFGSGSRGPSRQQSPAYNQGSGQVAPSPSAGRGTSGGGSFMRGLAGGLAGGLIGSMLFGSFGHAGGLGGGFGGGIGLLDIVLLLGVAFILFRLWKSRQHAAAASAYGGQHGGHGAARVYQSEPQLPYAAPSNPTFGGSLSAGTDIDPDIASDIFFKIQGAWTRRDLSFVRDLLGPDLEETLNRDLNDLKAKQQINRLENISVRRTSITHSWQEDGRDYSTVRMTANLLDYTVDETTGKVVAGSDREPVKFEEEWTFEKAPGNQTWRLVSIQQV